MGRIFFPFSSNVLFFLNLHPPLQLIKKLFSSSVWFCCAANFSAISQIFDMTADNSLSELALLETMTLNFMSVKPGWVLLLLMFHLHLSPMCFVRRTAYLRLVQLRLWQLKLITWRSDAGNGLPGIQASSKGWQEDEHQLSPWNIKGTVLPVWKRMEFGTRCKPQSYANISTFRQGQLEI